VLSEGAKSPAGARSAEPGISTDRILRNGTFNLAAQGVYALVYVAVIIALARGLSQVAFGTYFAIFALILVVQMLLEAGIGTVLTWRIAQAPEHCQETVAEAGSLFAGIGVASATVFLSLGAIWAWWRNDPALLICGTAAGVACAAIQVQRFSAAVFQAFETFHVDNLAKVVQVAIFAALVLGLVWGGWANLESVLAGLAASHVVAAGVLLVSLWRQHPDLAWCWARPRFRQWLGQAGPLGAGEVVRGLTWQLDTLLLAAWQPATVVAIYSIAYRPLGPLQWLPRAVLTAAFPAFARLAGGNHAALQRAFATSTRLLWVISLPIAVGICICAEPIVQCLAGPSYLEAAVPMRFLIWITVFAFLSYQFSFLLAALGQPRAYLRLVLMIFTVKAVLEAALIPYWGYFGACAGSLVGELLFTAAGLLLCRHLGVNALNGRSLAAAALAAAGMAAALWPARGLALPLLVLAGAGATGLYVVLCAGLGALRREELRHFLQIFTIRSRSPKGLPGR